MKERRVIVVGMYVDSDEDLQKAVDARISGLGEGWTIVSGQGSVAYEEHSGPFGLVTVVVEKQS